MKNKPTVKPPSMTERKACLGCAHPLPIRVERENDHDQDRMINRVIAGLSRDRGRIIGWQYAGYGHFCTQDCAVYYANKIVDMGITDHITVKPRKK